MRSEVDLKIANGRDIASDTAIRGDGDKECDDRRCMPLLTMQ